MGLSTENLEINQWKSEATPTSTVSFSSYCFAKAGTIDMTDAARNLWALQK